MACELERLCLLYDATHLEQVRRVAPSLRTSVNG